MTRDELQDEFEGLGSYTDQMFFIDLNLSYASDIALANELTNRGFRIRGCPDW